MVVLVLPVRHVGLLSKPHPDQQHWFLSSSSAVQIRIPISEHFAWAIVNVVTRHDSGAPGETQVQPFLLQHLTAPFADFDGISIGFIFFLPYGSPGHPSPRLPRFYQIKTLDITKKIPPSSKTN